MNTFATLIVDAPFVGAASSKMVMALNSHDFMLSYALKAPDLRLDNEPSL